MRTNREKQIPGNDAETLMREACPAYWDSIGFVEDYERVLINLGKFEDADRMGDRVMELANIYRR